MEKINDNNKDLNIYCSHITKPTFGNFCIICGAIVFQKIYSIKYKQFIFSHEIPQNEQFKQIETFIGYKSYFGKVKNNISDFYKRARISCVRYIKKLVEEHKLSCKTYIAAIFFLDLIYLNYDYYSILKDFKSELISVGCLLVALKFYEVKPKVPSFKNIKMFTFKDVNYEMNEIRKYEDYVLKFLNFKINYYTTCSILEFLLSNGVVFNYEFQDEILTSIREKVKYVNKLSFKILMNFVEDINYLNYNHIDIAFSCIVLAREILKFKELFPIEFEKVYLLKIGNFFKCYQYLAE